MPLSAREVGSAAAGGFARRQCAPVAGPSSKNAAALLAVAFVASCCHLKQVWTTFVGDSISGCGDTTIPVQTGAGKIVSESPLSELTSREEGGGDDAGDDI